MQLWFQKLIDVTAVARTEEMLKQTLAKLVPELGFDTYAYLNVQPARCFGVSNYSPEWQARYFTEGYMTVDPVISMAKAKMKAFAWAAQDSRQTASRQLRRFFSEAGDFGIRSGISIPVRTAFGHMSMLTLASHKPALLLERDIDQVVAAAAVAQLHARLEQFEIAPTASENVDLTIKQAICLGWSAKGKSMKAIAAIENMSYANVNFHMNNARKALDAGSLPQATALATKLKLI